MDSKALIAILFVLMYCDAEEADERGQPDRKQRFHSIAQGTRSRHIYLASKYRDISGRIPQCKYQPVLYELLDLRILENNFRLSNNSLQEHKLRVCS